jgi:hypothetical protein
MPANLGQTVASSWEAIVGSGPEDNIFDEYWLLDNLSKGSSFLSVNGGRTANGSIEYAVNTTFRSYSDTETLDTTRIDVFDEFSYSWKEYAGTVVMSELEKAKNQGEGRKFGLLPAKLENLRNSARKALNEGCFSDGTGNRSTARPTRSGVTTRRPAPRRRQRSTTCAPRCGLRTTTAPRA